MGQTLFVLSRAVLGAVSGSVRGGGTVIIGVGAAAVVGAAGRGGLDLRGDF
jgi:hypothetical protein